MPAARRTVIAATLLAVALTGTACGGDENGVATGIDTDRGLADRRAATVEGTVSSIEVDRLDDEGVEETALGRFALVPAAGGRELLVGVPAEVDLDPDVGEVLVDEACAGTLEGAFDVAPVPADAPDPGFDFALVGARLTRDDCRG